MNPILLRMKQLEEAKKDYEPLIYDAARYVNPRRELIKDSQRFDKRGQRRGKDIYDGTPASALGIWRDGLQGFMVSRSLKWFKSLLSAAELNGIDEVREYLQNYDEAMYGAYNRSNFYSVINEWFNDAGSVGTAPLYVEEDIAGGKTVHIPIHLREVFIAENRFQEVDVLFRKFQLTARQALQIFGESRLDVNIIKDAIEHPEKPYEFIHAVFPNDERQFLNITKTNKRYKSVYLQTKRSQGSDNMPNQPSSAMINAKGLPVNDIVKEGGYDVFPYAVWRFRKNSDEVYGYSPAMDLMVAIYGLNVFGKTLQQAAHLSVRPPVNVPKHMRGSIRMEPGGYNYYGNDGNKVEVVNYKLNYPVGVDQWERLQAIVEDGYRVEFFKAFIGRQGEATATEIMEIKAEQAQLMGPQVNRLVVDGLSKNFDIVADIEGRAGRLPDPPQILVDRVGLEQELGLQETIIQPRFTGPLAQAQRRMFALQPVKNGLRELAQASVLWPGMPNLVDEFKLGERLLDESDFPQEIMRNVDEAREMWQQQQAAIQQQQQLAALTEATKAVPNLSKGAEPNSPMEALTGAGV
jgi:hypothetical protein